MTAHKDPAAAAKGDVEKQVAKEQEQGFVGHKVDPRPNSDYTLESGPDSPPHVENDRTRIEQPSVAFKED